MGDCLIGMADSAHGGWDGSLGRWVKQRELVQYFSMWAYIHAGKGESMLFSQLCVWIECGWFPQLLIFVGTLLPCWWSKNKPLVPLGRFGQVVNQQHKNNFNMGQMGNFVVHSYVHWKKGIERKLMGEGYKSSDWNCVTLHLAPKCLSKVLSFRIPRKSRSV